MMDLRAADDHEDELLKAAHPRPWNWTAIVAALWGKAEEKAAAAKLIVKLVNEAGPF